MMMVIVMSLIRTDYVPEWRISVHAQSVLAAGQKHHSDRDDDFHYSDDNDDRYQYDDDDDDDN